MRRTTWRSALLAGLAISFAGGCAPRDGADEGGSASAATPPATAADSAGYLADRLLESLGGESAWASTRYLSFRWLVEREGAVVADREHAWDRYDGRYRLAYEQDSVRHLSLFNVNELRDDPELGKVPAGRAWIGTTELESAARDTALRRAYSIFINDSYWLLMPFKWRDPGVHLAYEGLTELSDGRAYPTVHLTFDTGLGVTEDQYWGYLDPDSGRMAAWRYHLGRSEEPGPLIWWRDWRSVGPLRLAADRVLDSGERTIYFEDLAASRTVPDGRFDPPNP